MSSQASTQIEPPGRGPVRALILEPEDGSLSFFTLALLAGAAESGWITRTIFVRDRQGAILSPDSASDCCSEFQPHLILFLMDAPLAQPLLWSKIPAAIPKISLWYDDFMRSPLTLGHASTWSRWQERDEVHALVWDGYWRERWLGWTGHRAGPIHLAADPAAFAPGAAPMFPEFAEAAVFAGTIPSIRSLESETDALPHALRGPLHDARAAAAAAPWPIRAYEAWDLALAAAPAKIRNAAAALLADPTLHAALNRILWRDGKRAARLRGLRAAAAAGPVAVVSGHGSEEYAGDDELRAELPHGARFHYRDTRGLPRDRWSSVFASGHFQLQFTDPQSIESGVPFRVFETALCAVPLLTDARPGLRTLFREPHHMFFADDEAALSTEASRLFSTPLEDLRAAGANGRAAALAEHTWAARCRAIERDFLR